MSITPRAAAAKGREAERQVVAYAREHGLVALDLHDKGTADEGDVALVTGRGLVCFQVKNMRDTARAVADGMRDLPAQQARLGAHYGAVVQRPHGQRDPARMRVVMELDQFIQLLGCDR